MISNVTRFIDLNNQKFRVKPKPQEDELLSSWLVRVARAHLTLTTSFTNMHFKEYKNQYKDRIERTTGKTIAVILSHQTAS